MPDDSLDGLDLEAGMKAAYDDDDGSSWGDASVLAQLAQDGRKLVPVLLTDPDSDIAPTPLVRPQGRRHGRYQVVGELARGGVGVVLKGHDVDLGRDVAMKVIREEHEETPEIIQRFVEEAQIGGQLQHPGIVPVYEIGLGKNKRPYFTMKLIKGQTLSALLAERVSPRKDRRRFLSIFESVCQTMAYAHARGVIHRDLKPSNVMVGAYGEVLVVDWGMGKVLRKGGIDDEMAARRKAEQTIVTTLRSEGEGSQSVVGSVMGTPRYMPPEQARGDIEAVDKRSDVFGLGAILCEILTGQPPYTGPDKEVFADAAMARLDDANRRLDECGADEELVAIARRCLMPAPEARYQDAPALAKAVSDHISAVEERAEEAKLAAVRAEERIESERAAATAAQKIAKKEKEAAHQAQRARRLTLALATAAVLFVAAGAGVWLYAAGADERERKETAAAVAAHLEEGARHLESGDLDKAAESAARAHERDPSAAGPLELRERIGEARAQRARDERAATAKQARDEAQALLREYTELRESIGTRTDRVEQDRKEIYLRYAEEKDRAEFALRERTLEQDRARLYTLLAEAREAVERARRLEDSEETLAVSADVALEQWRLARAPSHRPPAADQLDDTFDAGHNRALVRAHYAVAMRHDVAQRHRKELLGRGSLTIRATPANAEVHLFRYESYETVRTDRPVIPRLVPVPTSGIGRATIEGFTPGDACTVIEAVEPGSPAAKAGLRPGDLVLTVNGLPCDHGVAITSVVPGSPAEKAGLKPWTRLERVNEIPVSHYVHANHLMWLIKRNKKPLEIVAGGVRAGAPAGERVGFSRVPTLGLLFGPETAVRLRCLRDGELRELALEPGRKCGITPRVTAYPLVLAKANRVDAGRPLELDPGSYLVHVRREGYEPQRYSVVVPRGKSVEAGIVLHAAGESPEGFVYIPPGPFLFGDKKAFRAAPRHEKHLDGYWIQRTPLPTEDYLEFINDPAVRERMAESGDEHKFLPREKTGDGKVVLLVVENEKGDYRARRLYPETPILGISIDDVRAYVEWRNAKGGKWVYDLPTEAEFEKAARGADGRAFPWGPRFDSNLCVGLHRTRGKLFWAIAGFEPRDESPYGLTDTAGARYEFVNSEDKSALRHVHTERGYVCKGGWWSGFGARLAGRGWTESGPTAGFRLVAKRRR